VQAGALWRLFVSSALRFPWTLVTDKVEAAAVWIPPGEMELTDEAADGYEDFMVDLLGRPVAQVILTISEQFEAARPTEAHYYLSLLATHTDHRGAGLGIGLLRENLARIDALALPAYLESSNPANLGRYASVGFHPRQEITTPSGHIVTTMWRPST
jgi:GNAT superfamily N-acetyltransferase